MKIEIQGGFLFAGTRCMAVVAMIAVTEFVTVQGHSGKELYIIRCPSFEIPADISISLESI